MQASRSGSSSGGKNKKSKLMTPEQFQAAMDKHLGIAKQLDRDLLDVSKASKSKGKQGAQVQQEGQQAQVQEVPYDLNKIRSLKTANLKMLRRLVTDYGKAYRLAREDRVGSANSAFSNPVVVRDVLVEFFRNADLGTLTDGSTPVQAALSVFLAPGAMGPLASRSILASALSLYAKRHRLYALSTENRGKTEEQMNRQVLGADEYMLRTLAPLFDELERVSAAKLVAEGKRDGQPKPQDGKRVRKYYRDNADGSRTLIWNDFEHAFNRNNFSYSAFQSLFSAGGIIDKKAKTANPQLAPGVDFDAFVITPDVGRRYMQAVSQLKEAARANPAIMGNPGATFTALATEAAQGAPSQALVARSALDTVHALVSSASSQYNQQRPKQKSRKPKKQNGVQVGQSVSR